MAKEKEVIEFVVVKNVGMRIHQQHAEKEKLWNFLLASWRGGLGMSGRMGMTEEQARDLKVSGYFPGLFKFKREALIDYCHRVAMSPYTPIARQIVDEYVKYVTKDEPDRKNAEKWKDLIENADRQGRPMGMFIRDTLALAMVMGEVGVLVDMPSTDEDILSQADALDKGMRAYASIVLPQNIVDWSIGTDGKYEWLIIETTNLISSVDDDEAKTVTTRTFWDKNVWQVYQNDEKTNKTEKDSTSWKLKGSGKHPCKEVPVIRIVTNNIDQNELTPESWFFDLADLNRAMYNVDSLDFANLYRQTFGILVLPATDGSENEATVLSRAHALTEDVDTKGLTRYVQTTGAAGETFDRKINELKARIYQTAGLQYQTNKVVPESGISKAWDFQRVNQFLVGLSKTAEHIENNISRLAGLWEAKGEGYTAHYPTEYGVQELADIIEGILGIQVIGFASETGRKEAVKRLYREVLPDLSVDVQATIDAEIDASEAPTVEAFDDGRGDGDDEGNI